MFIKQPKYEKKINVELYVLLYVRVYTFIRIPYK